MAGPVADSLGDIVRGAWARVIGRRAARRDAAFATDNPMALTRLRILYHLEAALGRSLAADPFRTATRPSEFLRVLTARPPAMPPAVFLFPGIGGDDPLLMLLRAGLPDDVRIAVIGYPDWPEQDPLGFDFTALVRFVAAQIAAQAPAGPLRLAGYSLGGHLAYAVALKLLAEGREIVSLAILDTAWMSLPRQTPWWSPGRFTRFAGMAWRGEALPSAAHFLARLMIARPALFRRIAPRRMRLPLDFGFFIRRALMMELHLRTLQPWLEQVLHQPAPLTIDVVLFRSTAHAADVPPDLYWGRCCPRLRVVPVPGTHHGMFSPEHIAAFRAGFLAALKLAPETKSSPGA